MIELKKIGNDYYLNGVKGDEFSKFNNDGKYKQKSYVCYIDENSKLVSIWKFYGKL